MPAPFISWAPNANYATGTGFAWQGNPTKVTPAYVEFQPSPTFSPSAQEFNAMFAARDAVINAIIDEIAVPTFMPSYILNTIGGAVTASVCAWDPITLKWLIGGVDSSTHTSVLTGRGDLLGWVFAGGGADTSSSLAPQSVCRGIEPSVSNKYIYASVLSSGTPVVIRVDTVGLAFVTVPLPEGAISDATQTLLASVSGAVVATIGAASSGHTGIFHTVDHGTTWVAGPSPGAAASGWLLAQSVPGAGTILAMPVIAVSGGTGYYYSTDGVTWSTGALTGLAATETPTTLCYGVDGAGVACWVLTTFDSGALATNIYRSYDGASWTTVTNSLPASTPLLRMACAGQQLVAVVEDSTGAGFNRVVYSVDGGSTWLTTNLEILVGTAAHCSLAASANQFLIATDAVVCASTCVGSPGGFGAQ